MCIRDRAYTITHHTRQSAVGLPFIKEREYDGKSYSVTEYTMSEIIASVYEKMEATGLKEGILFIDEINCVSETLAPTMLQFLQCKTFGNQAVPKGWVIVAAGNPPEYNKSVRDFDMVTLDRVRYISIEADYQVWKDVYKRQLSNSLPAKHRLSRYGFRLIKRHCLCRRYFCHDVLGHGERPYRQRAQNCHFNADARLRPFHFCEMCIRDRHNTA